jgi:anti-sigma factor RsiW
VDTRCQAVRRQLEDAGTGLPAEVRAHLESCPACARHAALLAILDGAAAGPVDEAEALRVVRGLPRAAWQLRRLATWMPLLAGAALLVTGLVLLPLRPVGGTISGFPALAGGVFAWVISLLHDLLIAVRESRVAVQVVLAAAGTWVMIWLGLTALGGGLLVHALLRRDVRRRSW